MKKRTLVIILGLALISFNLSAQNKFWGYPNGLRLGVIGEGNIAPKMSIIENGDYIFDYSSKPAAGWKSGLELSYNFLDYFGISVGFLYGTDIQLKFSPEIINYKEAKESHPYYYRHLNGFQLPIKFNFNIPFNNKWAFFGAVGTNIRKIDDVIEYRRGIRQGAGIEYHWVYMLHEEINCIGDDTGKKILLNEYRPFQVKADLVLNLGFTYQLPYFDLIRCSIATNISFQDDAYAYFGKSYNDYTGILSYRHNLIGVELAYIHCFQYNKR